MTLFENIKPGCRLRGLGRSGLAEIVQVAQFGPDALNRRAVMSSIMRCRSGLMGLSDIAKAPVSHGVEPHDLETGPRTSRPSQRFRSPSRRSPPLQRERFSSWAESGPKGTTSGTTAVRATAVIATTNEDPAAAWPNPRRAACGCRRENRDRVRRYSGSLYSHRFPRYS